MQKKKKSKFYKVVKDEHFHPLKKLNQIHTIITKLQLL